MSIEFVYNGRVGRSATERWICDELPQIILQYAAKQARVIAQETRSPRRRNNTDQIKRIRTGGQPAGWCLTQPVWSAIFFASSSRRKLHTSTAKDPCGQSILLTSKTRLNPSKRRATTPQAGCKCDEHLRRQNFFWNKTHLTI